MLRSSNVGIIRICNRTANKDNTQCKKPVHICVTFMHSILCRTIVLLLAWKPHTSWLFVLLMSLILLRNFILYFKKHEVILTACALLAQQPLNFSWYTTTAYYRTQRGGHYFMYKVTLDKSSQC